MKTKINRQIGDVLFLTMLKPENGKYPICRDEDGRICLIKKTKEKRFFEYGSVWMCNVEEVNEKKLIVDPVSEEISSKENLQNTANKILTAFGKPKRVKQKPNKKQFPFLASYERQATKIA